MVAGNGGGQPLDHDAVATSVANPRLNFLAFLISRSMPLLATDQRMASRTSVIEGLPHHFLHRPDRVLTMARIIRGQILSLIATFVLRTNVRSKSFNIVSASLPHCVSRAAVSDSHGPCGDSGRIVPRFLGSASRRSCHLGIVISDAAQSSIRSKGSCVCGCFTGDRDVITFYP